MEQSKFDPLLQPAGERSNNFISLTHDTAAAGMQVVLHTAKLTRAAGAASVETA